MKHRSTRAGVRRHPLHRLAAARALAGGALVMAAVALTAQPARADFRLCNNTGNRKTKAGPPKAGGTSPPAAARLCCGARSLRASITSMRSTMTAAENGPARHSCARGKRSSPSAVRTIASRAAMIAPAFSKSIPATSRPGPSNSPNRPTKHPCNPCNRAFRCFRPRRLRADPPRQHRRREAATDATSADVQRLSTNSSGIAEI
jgi:hypothetical protein